MHVFDAPAPMHLPAGAETVPRPLTVIERVPAATAVKLALADRDDVSVTVQVDEEPLQAPAQPLKDAPGAGVAVRVTADPDGRLTLQTVAPLPQLIPPPLTVPPPPTVTENSTVVVPAAVVKVAVSARAAVTVTVRVGRGRVQLRPPQPAPVHPVKVAPVAGVAISVTVAFWANAAEQTMPPLPQLIAPAPPLTLPLPSTLTVRIVASVKVAVTVRESRGSSIDTVHWGPAPAQSPVQPVKT